MIEDELIKYIQQLYQAFQIDPEQYYKLIKLVQHLTDEVNLNKEEN